MYTSIAWNIVPKPMLSPCNLNVDLDLGNWTLWIGFQWKYFFGPEMGQSGVGADRRVKSICALGWLNVNYKIIQQVLNSFELKRVVTKRGGHDHWSQAPLTPEGLVISPLRTFVNTTSNILCLAGTGTLQLDSLDIFLLFVRASCNQ